MRPHVVIIVLLAAVVVIGSLALTRRHSTTPAPVTVATTTTPEAGHLPATLIPSTPAATAIVTSPLPSEEHQAAIDAEVDRIHELTGKRDAASISVLTADLTSPDKEIRLAAIEAVKQSDDTNVVPILKADADSAPDSDTQIALLEAADFLSLPDISISSPDNSAPETPEQMQAAQQKLAALRTQPPPQNRGHGTTAPSVPGN